LLQNYVKIQDQLTRSKVLVTKKGLFIIHLYLMYQIHNTFGSKDIARLKVFKTRSNFKITLTRSNVLLQNERIHHEVSICELSESYHPWFKIIIAGIKFFKARSKFMMKVTRSKVLIPKVRSIHKASIF
jgi:hypothetical protein